MDNIDYEGGQKPVDDENGDVYGPFCNTTGNPFLKIKTSMKVITWLPNQKWRNFNTQNIALLVNYTKINGECW